MSKLSEASAFYREKKHAEAVEAARKAVAYKPDYGDAHYDLACYLSLAGDVEESLESLKTALKLSPGLLSLAEKDADLDNVRSNPRYKQIMSAASKSQKAKRR
jgi:tetratricopeptide (TPR) repeat protein